MIMRVYYEEQLRKLETQMIVLGTMCEEAISEATKALVEGDFALAEKVMQQDVKVNQQEREIETLCLKLLLHQQPLAGDLRNISAALKMITDLERLGDQAADIAEIVSKAKLKLPEKFQHISKMGGLAMEMVKESLKAYVDRDLELARKVIDSDDAVDELFVRVKEELLEAIRLEHETGEMALDLFTITKYYERIGDHATNVAEWVEYALTGVHRGDF